MMKKRAKCRQRCAVSQSVSGKGEPARPDLNSAMNSETMSSSIGFEIHHVIRQIGPKKHFPR